MHMKIKSVLVCVLLLLGSITLPNHANASESIYSNEFRTYLAVSRHLSHISRSEHISIVERMDDNRSIERRKYIQRTIELEKELRVEKNNSTLKQEFLDTERKAVAALKNQIESISTQNVQLQKKIDTAIQEFSDFASTELGREYLDLANTGFVKDWEKAKILHQTQILPTLQQMEDHENAILKDKQRIRKIIVYRTHANMLNQKEDIGQATLGEVITAYNDLVALDPTHHEDWFHLANLLVNYNRLDLARVAALKSLDTAKNEQEKAFAYRTLGDISINRSQLGLAQSYLEKSTIIRKRLVDNNPNSDDHKMRYALGLLTQVDLFLIQNEHNAAIADSQKASDILRLLSQKHQKSDMIWSSLSRSHQRIGDARRAKQRSTIAGRANPNIEEYVGNYKLALDIAKQVFELNKDDTDYFSLTLVLHDRLCRDGIEIGNESLMNNHCNEFVEGYEKLAEIDSYNAVYKRDLALGYTRLGQVAYFNLKLKEAEDFYLKAHDISAALFEEDAQNGDIANGVAFILWQQAELKNTPEVWGNLVEFYKNLESKKILRPTSKVNYKDAIDLRDGKANHFHPKLYKSLELIEEGHIFQKKNSLSLAISKYDTAQKVIAEVLKRYPANPAYIKSYVSARYFKVHSSDALNGVNSLPDILGAIYSIEALPITSETGPTISNILMQLYSWSGQHANRNGNREKATSFNKKSLEHAHLFRAYSPNNASAHAHIVVALWNLAYEDSEEYLWADVVEQYEKMDALELLKPSDVENLGKAREQMQLQSQQK